MATPLAPAVHLGASRIITVSTRHKPGRSVAIRREGGYPAPAQILGQLFNAIFHDAVDHDTEQLRRLNALVRDLPPEKKGSLRGRLSGQQPVERIAVVHGELPYALGLDESDGELLRALRLDPNEVLKAEG